MMTRIVFMGRGEYPELGRCHANHRINVKSPDPQPSSGDSDNSTGGLQDGKLLLLSVSFSTLVNEVEYDGGSPEPLSTVARRPNAIWFWKLIYECLNEWIKHFAGIVWLYAILEG
jgi:hypothetical protein